jgi:type II secretory pathway pseudopilin PulG
MSAAAFISSLAAIAVIAAVCFAGGWVLRGMRDQARAEVRRDAEWDAEHGAEGVRL